MKPTQGSRTSGRAVSVRRRSARCSTSPSRRRRSPKTSDAESLFQDEVESGALFLADIQLRAELPAAAAKTAYDTVVAKRDKRSQEFVVVLSRTHGVHTALD